MKLYSWNVNGIRAVVNKGTFQTFMSEHQPDILGLQETKAMQGQAEIDLPEYAEYWNSATKKGYSGTAIFTKIAPKAVTYGLPDTITKQFDTFADAYGDPLNEGRITTAEYDQFFLCHCVYPQYKGRLITLAVTAHVVGSCLFGICTVFGTNKASNL
jgi:exodeoxyribonuclease-3